MKCSFRGGIALGFTLLENVFAGFLLVTIFGVLITLYPASLMNLRAGHDMLAASNYAQQLMEQARTTPFDTLAATPPSGLEQHAVFDGISMTGTVRVNSLQSDSQGKPILLDIAVTVQWDTGRPNPSGGDVQKTVSYDTQLYRLTNPSSPPPAASTP